MNLRRIEIVCSLTITAVFMSGCAGRVGPASVLGGECKLVASPEYAVLGKTPYDQRWVNRTEEAIVTGCGQPRPKARPASFDTPSRSLPPVAAEGFSSRRPFGAATSPRLSSEPIPATLQPTTSTPTQVATTKPHRLTLRERVRKWLHLKPKPAKS